MITFESVTKRYPDGTVAVDALDLEAPSGQITVLVGPSGCGKTTSLRMVNRMVEPSEGRILIDGEDTAAANLSQLRRGIGYVIQQAGLFPHRTVADNIATVPRLVGTKRRDARRRATELLELVGLAPELADRYPAQLSGGQQQRVGVARALAADPPIMLMDEPFSAVDPIVREQLQDEFLRLQGELGKTILFVTHDVDEAIKLGDQVAVLRQGGLLAQLAPPAELLARPDDDFVADFVGRDRGYRALSFVEPRSPRLHEEPTVPLGAGLDEATRTASDDWLLVVDGDGRPQGWVAVPLLTGPITAADLERGGTVARRGGSLRALLDAALSAPSGRGVVADEDGRLLGTVRPSEVLGEIEQERARAQRETLTAEASGGSHVAAETG
ncbi:MAG: ABC transporter ATP-binding protein [Actinomycetes bacterium]